MADPRSDWEMTAPVAEKLQFYSLGARLASEAQARTVAARKERTGLVYVPAGLRAA